MPRFRDSRRKEADHARFAESVIYRRYFSSWQRADGDSLLARYIQQVCKVDVVALNQRGELKGIDEKVVICIDREFYAENIIIETVSNVERYGETGDRRYLGWWYTSRADYLAYIYVQEYKRRGFVRFYPLDGLRAALPDEELKRYPYYQTETGDGLYHTGFHAVPAAALDGRVLCIERAFQEEAAA